MERISQSTLARELGVNRSTITYYVKKGFTHEQIREVINARRHAEEPAKEGAKTDDVGNSNVGELRKKKLAAEIVYKEIQSEQARVRLSKDQSKLVEIEDVNDLVVHLAAITKGVIQAFVNKLPGKLEGLTASEMVPVLREEAKTALFSIAEEADSQINIITNGK